MKEEVYESERYKNPMEELIQVPCEKVDEKETLYQAVYRKIREETGLHTVLKYLTKDDQFNCNLYTTDIIGQESPQWLELEKNKLWVFYE